MTSNDKEKKLLFFARTAGILYLIIIVSGIFSEVFIRSRLIVNNNAAATAANIATSESLFRIGFAADAVMLLCDVAIAVLFYVLLKPAGRIPALFAAAFRLTQASILGLNLLNYYAALMLLTGSGYPAVFEPDQLQGLMMMMLDMHSHGYDLGLLFFGLSNLFLGYLVVKADYFPGILGYGLIGAAVVYLAGSFARFLIPDYLSIVKPFYIIPLIAELSFCLWLLIKGIKRYPSSPDAPV